MIYLKKQLLGTLKLKNHWVNPKPDLVDPHQTKNGQNAPSCSVQKHYMPNFKAPYSDYLILKWNWVKHGQKICHAHLIQKLPVLKNVWVKMRRTCQNGLDHTFTQYSNWNYVTYDEIGIYWYSITHFLLKYGLCTSICQTWKLKSYI